jgi:hypothetical protein
MLRTFARKNPMASAGSEPTIWGSRGQHATHLTTEAAAWTLVKTWLQRAAGSDNNSLYKVYGVYCEQVMKLQGRQELKQSVIHPGGGSVVLSAWRLVMNCLCSLLEAVVVNTEIVENLGFNYCPELYCWTLCRAWRCFNMTSGHKVHFDTGTVWVTLVIITCRSIGMLSTV